MTRKPTYEELERRIKELEEAVDRKANEASLQVSLEKYRVAFDTAKDAIFVTDETGRFVDVNRAACESLGYSKEELLQLSNMELDADERGYEAFLKLRNGLAETETFEVNQRKKDGTLLPVEITGSFFDCQRVRMSVAIARNITVRKQAEEMLQKAHDELERMVEERTAELAKSEARYRQMVENPLVGVWQADIKGRFVFISKRLAEMSGYSQDEVIGMSMMVPIAPELRSLLAERMQKRKAGKLPPEVVEAEMVRKDGSRYTALVAPATLYDEEEKFNGFIGTMIDITERKRAEEKIKKLSSAVEQSIDGIAIGDLGPKLTYVNNAFSRMHGYSAEEMIGMKVANLHNEEQMDEYERDMHQIKTQGSWIGELGHIRKDGTPFPTYMSVTLLKDDNGMPAGILGVARDITEQKRTEQALREREKELKIKTKSLEETNTALRVLLKKRDEDRTELEEKVLSNVKELVLPYLVKLKRTGLDQRQKTFASILESNIDDIISPFLRRMSSRYLGLTPAEIQVANLVRLGKTTKDIATLLNISSKTIEGHRKNIRKKLGIKNKKANLRTHLQSIQ